MILRDTGKKYSDGRKIVLFGDTVATAIEHLQEANGDLSAMPLTNDVIAKRANISYTRKDGTVSRTQKGDAVVLSVHGTMAVTKNVYATPSGKSDKTVVAIWDTSAKEWYPEHFMPAESFGDFQKAIANVKM